MPRAAYDFIAIGLGPFNLGLACLTEPIDELNGLFLEKNEYFNWHPGMLLEDATLQTPFMGDLVTLADPTSQFSFLNYMKEQGRIYSFYIREDFFLVRAEFNAYCQWASDRLPNIHFNRAVEKIEWEDGLYAVHVRCTRTGDRVVHYAPKLVLGTGTSPHVPACCRGLEADISHTSSYLDEKEMLQKKSSIAVVGSGQSAAEVFYDLLQDIDTAGYALSWITRSPRFFPLELTKLTLEMTSPDYADYFFHLDPDKRDAVVSRQKNLYKGINVSLINDIYDTLYKKRLKGELKVTLHTNTEMRTVTHDRETGVFDLGLHQIEQDQGFGLQTEAIVLGTGYSYRVPEFLRTISDRIAWDDKGRFDVRRNYSIDHEGKDIFVQNAELHTHGFVAPDLGMASYRNACIIRELLGRDYYPIENSIAFQSFAAPEDAESIPPAQTAEIVRARGDGVAPAASAFARGASFETRVPGVGRLALRPIDMATDIAMIHDWVTQPYARYWNMGSKSLAEIESFYGEMDASGHEAVLVGVYNGKPAFITEVYDPAHHELAQHYDVRKGDRGMHVLVAPAGKPIPGFTSAVFRTIMEFLFADPSVARVVVEPDVRNGKIHVLNERYGFIRERDIELKDKTAALSFCTRTRFEAAIEMGEAA